MGSNLKTTNKKFENKTRIYEMECKKKIVESKSPTIHIDLSTFALYSNYSNVEDEYDNHNNK